MEKLYLVVIIFIIFVFGVTYVLKFLDIKTTDKSNLPYVKKPFLMTETERKFFFVLERAVRDRYYIVPQVQLSNLVQIEKSKRWEYALRNRIDRKSVDFVLFDKEYFTPQVVVELDDPSHFEEKRKERDDLVNALMKKTGIKIIHIPTSGQYDLSNLFN